MSRQYQAETTLTIAGDERDVRVRAYVSYEVQPGGSWGGSIDGDVEVLLHGEWLPLGDLDIGPGESERAEEALCEECSNDDRDEERYAS